jgi:rhodanese-related sulfurtransferase
VTLRSISPAQAWEESQRTGRPILDLRTRTERHRYGQPPGSQKVTLLRHAIIPQRDAIYLCQHAVRSKLPAARGGREIAGGFVAWKADHQPVEGGA